jgi:hypothetical protein
MEQVYRGYVYATLTQQIALSAEILHEVSSAEGLPFNFEDWRTTSVPVTLSYFSETGIFGTLGFVYVDHEFSDPGDGGSDSFAIVNLGVGYRLPANRGVFSLEVQNVFDESFNYQNRSIRPDLNAAPRYAPERTILARGTVHF